MFSRNTQTYIWDVVDLENPVLENTYLSTETAIDHNQYISGDLTFQSNYEAGLRILQIDQDNYDLTEMAYFDMLPDSTTVNFAGTWSNYPWFNNGRCFNLAAFEIDGWGLCSVRRKNITGDLDRSNILFCKM